MIPATAPLETNFETCELSQESADAGLNSLPLLDSTLIANRFPCFDSNTEVHAYTDHGSGGGYTNSQPVR